MSRSVRCLYNDNLDTFLMANKNSIFGVLCDRYHGDALTTSREAWMGEIEILQTELLEWKGFDGHIIFEYDIPRLGKRIDVVLLLKGIIFCLEFKVDPRTASRPGDVIKVAMDVERIHVFDKETQQVITN